MYASATPKTPTNCNKLRDQVKDWLVRMTPAANDEHARFAVTLTFNQAKVHKNSKSGTLTKTEEVCIATRCFSQFRMSLDRKILKSAASRHGKELSYVPVLEGQAADKQVHYHGVIVTPSWVTLADMDAAVKAAWMSTGFAGFEINVQPMRDDGWLTYISKEAWTLRQDCVDIDNVRLSACPERC